MQVAADVELRYYARDDPNKRWKGKKWTEANYDLCKDRLLNILAQSERCRILSSNLGHSTIHCTPEMIRFLERAKRSAIDAKELMIEVLNHLVIDIQRGLNDIELLGSAMFKMINVRDGIPEMEQEMDHLIHQLALYCLRYIPPEAYRIQWRLCKSFAYFGGNDRNYRPLRDHFPCLEWIPEDRPLLNFFKRNSIMMS